MIGFIDWSKMITKEMKAEAKSQELLTSVTLEMAHLRKIADAAIVPLQDAVDLDIATEEEIVLLRAWKVYRVALSRVPNQVGYHEVIEWPVMPA